VLRAAVRWEEGGRKVYMMWAEGGRKVYMMWVAGLAWSARARGKIFGGRRAEGMLCIASNRHMEPCCSYQKVWNGN